MSQIQHNIEVIRLKMEQAALRSGRSPQEITLIAVTKTMPVEKISEAIACSIADVGENKVQEIQNKHSFFSTELRWHLIGHLQTNKVKHIIDKVTLIHSVDSDRLAKKISDEAAKFGKLQDVLLQVNVAMEETKFGVESDAVEKLLREVSTYPNIRVRGLMTIAPFVENPEENRPVFRKLKQIMVDMNLKNIDNVDMDMLSMGMTNDYEVAIEEGATLVRIGTAIFGERDYH